MTHIINTVVGAVNRGLNDTVIDPDESLVGNTLLFALTMSLVVMVGLSGFAILSGIIFVLAAALFAVVPLGIAKFISIAAILLLCAVVLIGAAGLVAPRNQPI